MNRKREKLWLRLCARDLLSRSLRYLVKVFLGWVIVSAVWSILLVFPVPQQSFDRRTMWWGGLGGPLWMTLPIKMATCFFNGVRDDVYSGVSRGRYVVDMSRVQPDIPFNDPITRIFGLGQSAADRMIDVEFEIEINPSSLTLACDGRRLRYQIGKDVFFKNRKYSWGKVAVFLFREDLSVDWRKIPESIRRYRYSRAMFYENEVLLRVEEFSSGFSVFPFNWESEDSYHLRFIRVGDIPKPKRADEKNS